MYVCMYVCMYVGFRTRTDKLNDVFFVNATIIA